MNGVWVGGRLLVDRATLAEFFGVSERTVRRHCQPQVYRPQAGQRRGQCGKALYDAEAAADALALVSPRNRGQALDAMAARWKEPP